MSYRRCGNPKCMDALASDYKMLCPSCAFIGKIAFAIGALIAGALMKLLG